MGEAFQKKMSCEDVEIEQGVSRDWYRHVFPLINHDHGRHQAVSLVSHSITVQKIRPLAMFHTYQSFMKPLKLY